MTWSNIKANKVCPCARRETVSGSGGVAPRIMNLGTRSLLVSLAPLPLYVRGKSPDTPWIGGLAGPTACPSASENEKFLVSTGSRTEISRFIIHKVHKGKTNKMRQSIRILCFFSNLIHFYFLFTFTIFFLQFSLHVSDLLVHHQENQITRAASGTFPSFVVISCVAVGAN